MSESACHNAAYSDATCRLFAVVMAGGAGTRLWPESRRRRPKPFLSLAPDGRSLLDATLDRLDALVTPERRFLVANRVFAELVAPTLDAGRLCANRVLLEPVGRNTAPCIAWSALEAMRVDPDATLIALPSDHWITPEGAFRDALRHAATLVNEEPRRLVTLGIAPTEPSSLYGYIERGELVEGDVSACHVARFCEKPTVERAREFVDSGRFFWNAGVFVWKARRIVELIRELEPELAPFVDRLAALVDDAARRGVPTADLPEFNALFSGAKSVSIDYAVLEKAHDVVVTPVDSFRWSDVGSFSALERLGAASARPFELVESGASGTYARVGSSQGTLRKKLVVVSGVDDLLVVDTEDALLVARKNDDAAIQRLVEELRRRGFDDYL